MRLVQEVCADLGIYLLNSINPFRIEGQKTIGWELLQDLDWEPPDWIVLPAGNLGNTAALGKALQRGAGARPDRPPAAPGRHPGRGRRAVLPELPGRLRGPGHA